MWIQRHNARCNKDRETKSKNHILGRVNSGRWWKKGRISKESEKVKLMKEEKQSGYYSNKWSDQFGPM